MLKRWLLNVFRSWDCRNADATEVECEPLRAEADEFIPNQGATCKSDSREGAVCPDTSYDDAPFDWEDWQDRFFQIEEQMAFKMQFVDKLSAGVVGILKSLDGCVRQVDMEVFGASFLNQFGADARSHLAATFKVYDAGFQKEFSVIKRDLLAVPDSRCGLQPNSPPAPSCDAGGPQAGAFALKAQQSCPKAREVLNCFLRLVVKIWEPALTSLMTISLATINMNCATFFGLNRVEVFLVVHAVRTLKYYRLVQRAPCRAQTS